MIYIKYIHIIMIYSMQFRRGNPALSQVSDNFGSWAVSPGFHDPLEEKMPLQKAWSSYWFPQEFWCFFVPAIPCKEMSFGAFWS